MPSWKSLTKRSKEGQTPGAMVMFEQNSITPRTEVDQHLEYRRLRGDPASMAKVRLFWAGEWDGDRVIAHALNTFERAVGILHRPYICERMVGGLHEPSACAAYGMEHRKEQGDRWWDRDTAQEDAALEGVVRATERLPEAEECLTPGLRQEHEHHMAEGLRLEWERLDRFMGRTT